MTCRVATRVGGGGKLRRRMKAHDARGGWARLVGRPPRRQDRQALSLARDGGGGGASRWRDVVRRWRLVAGTACSPLHPGRAIPVLSAAFHGHRHPMVSVAEQGRAELRPPHERGSDPTSRYGGVRPPRRRRYVRLATPRGRRQARGAALGRFLSLSLRQPATGRSWACPQWRLECAGRLRRWQSLAVVLQLPALRFVVRSCPHHKDHAGRPLTFARASSLLQQTSASKETVAPSRMRVAFKRRSDSAMCSYAQGGWRTQAAQGVPRSRVGDPEVCYRRGERPLCGA